MSVEEFDQSLSRLDGEEEGGAWRKGALVRIATRAIALFVGAGLAAIAAELIARDVIRIEYRRTAGGYFVSSTLWRLEGNGLSHWTETGIRATDVNSVDDPAIAVLGDSFTEAYQVNDDQVFTAIVEKSLRRENLSYRVLNLGFSGGSPADYCLYATKVRERLRPQWTVVELNEADLGADAWSASKNHFRYADDGVVVPVEVAGTMFKQPVKKSHESMALVYAWRRLQAFRAAAAEEPPLFLAGSVRHRSERQAVGPAHATEILDSLQKAYRGRVTYLLVPSFDPLKPLIASSREEKDFSCWCRTTSASCVNLRSRYGSFAREHRSPFGFPNSDFYSGHMNANGHEAAAGALLEELNRLRRNGLF